MPIVVWAGGMVPRQASYLARAGSIPARSIFLSTSKATPDPRRGRAQLAKSRLPMKTMIPSFPQWPNGSDVTVLLQLERTIMRLGLPLGFDGDPLADRYPEADTHDDIVAACDLMQALPAKLRNYDRRLAHAMCKAAVFGRTRSEDRSLPPQAPSTATADAKLTRERKRAKGAA